MKKFISGFILGAIMFSLIGAFAATYVANSVNFKILVNGSEFASDPPAVSIEGRTYLPLRAMGKALGVPVNWNEELKQVEVGNMPKIGDGAGIVDGKYYIEILSVTKAIDYKGKNALIVNFKFTNNSDKTISFMGATASKAFQNKVQLETAMITGNSNYSSENQIKDVQPGGTIAVQKAFILSDNSAVQIEVSPLFSLNDTGKISKTFNLQ
ncbi:MAG: DUF5067 domain-containing protein [Bacillota bacterium]|nr:DUF5067 domain-containing protein [Bacillota bacterium]